MFYGSLQPTAGEILWRGAPLRVDNPAQARALGIAMVFQRFSLFEALTVSENIALALPPGPSLADLSARIEALSQDYGLPLTANQVVADLSVGERQQVEIIRCLLQEPAVLIMDEPTAVLTPQEADQLFDTLRRLAAEGCAVLLHLPSPGRGAGAVPPRHHSAPWTGRRRSRPGGRNRRFPRRADGRHVDPGAG